MSALMQYRTKRKAQPGLQIVKPAETILVDGTPFTRQQVKALQRAGVDLQIDGGAQTTQRRYKDTPGQTATYAGTPTLQGPFGGNTNQWGILSQPGVRPERFGVLPRPLSFMRMLIEQGGMTKSEYFNDILGILTGVSAAGGTNATGWCGTPPTPGQLKAIARIFLFGSFLGKTRLNAVPDIGDLVNRADIPGRILNAGPEANPLVPDIMYQLTDTRSQLATELYTFGHGLAQSLEQVGVLGNTALASTSTHWGWIQEFSGLDNQITTGITDAFANPTVTANAVDSQSENWGNQLVGGTQTSSGRNIVQLIADLYVGAQLRAAQVGMEGFEMAIVMRPEFFRALTDVYACSYATARCTNGAVGTPQIIDQTVVNNLRLEMYDNQYLLIEGVKVPVVFSQGITLTQVAANQYINSFYFVPISWAGRPLLRLEYFPMDNQYAQEYRSYVSADFHRVINNGLYLVGMEHTAICTEYHFASKMRLILETPFLAARVDNVNFTYLVNSFSPYSGETGLYRDGGVTYRQPYYTGYGSF